MADDSSDPDLEGFEEALKRGREALERVERSRRVPAESKPTVIDDAALKTALEDLRRENAERFALNQKIQSDVHGLFMDVVGRELKRPPDSSPHNITKGDEPAPKGGEHTPSQSTTVAKDGDETDQRTLIDAFISKLTTAGRKITRKDIWRVAGYSDATEFERFQRGDSRTTQSAASAFNRVLGMTPEKFIESLDKKAAAK